MSTRIFPRNLTARAAIQIAGNPVTTRLESGVGNCFPGLEFDHRNLDRRFFPGLVFNFGVMPPILTEVDSADSALLVTTPVGVDALSIAVRAAMNDLRGGTWHLTSLAQGGRTINLAETNDLDDPAQLWRFVRDLLPDMVTIVLSQSPTTPAPATATPPAQALAAAPSVITKTLAHYRRQYIDVDTGVIPEVYRPGELTQSLCSPWMHDFRDCACDYWASNHPDIVLGEQNFPTSADLANIDAQSATRPLDWLRADRQSRVAALPSSRANDAYRLRHYQINSAWRSLGFVFEGRENSGLYAPGFEASAAPFGTVEELAIELRQLCGLEHVVMLEYLYAYYSLQQPAALAGRKADDLTFVRHELLAVAVSEMRHLRWANQILWGLAKEGLIKAQSPALSVASDVPTVAGERPRTLRPLSPDALADFIAVERPSGTLDGAYARVVATLSQGYPNTLLQLARQIVVDGLEHFSRFSEISQVLSAWTVADGAAAPWLRPITLANSEQAADALAAYQHVVSSLAAAYARGDMEDAAQIIEARSTMMRLDAEAEKLAQQGLGIPFF